jgi:hypothetical protein
MMITIISYILFHYVAEITHPKGGKMKKLITMVVMSMSLSSAFAGVPEGFYEDGLIRVKVTDLRAIMARKKARAERDEKIELAKVDCHAIYGDFSIGHQWTVARRYGKARYVAKSSAEISCVESE